MERKKDTYNNQLKRARNGEHKASEWLISSETPWLIRRINARLPVLDAVCQAEDLAQECSLRFLTKRETLRFESQASLRAWLWKVARNHWVSTSMRRRQIAETPLLDPEGQTHGHMELRRSGALQEPRRQLPPRQDTAIMLRDYFGCSFEIIAGILSCPTVASARGLRARALSTIALDSVS